MYIRLEENKSINPLVYIIGFTQKILGNVHVLQPIESTYITVGEGSIFVYFIRVTVCVHKFLHTFAKIFFQIKQNQNINLKLISTVIEILNKISKI